MRIRTTSPVAAGSALPLLARIYTTGGAVAVPGNFTTISLTVYDTEDMKNPLVNALNLSPISSYVFSTLQYDRDWTINFDATGYNFCYITLATDLPVGGKLYQLQFRPAGGSPFAFNVPTLALTGR